LELIAWRQLPADFIEEVAGHALPHYWNSTELRSLIAAVLLLRRSTFRVWIQMDFVLTRP